MTFLHPALLCLLILAAVPILFHLMTLHRVKTMELSTFRFLFDGYQQQRRRMQLVDVLLALLRAGFILLLVCGVARPVFQSWSSLFPTGSDRDVILLIDCSASMNVQSGGVSALQRAKTAARSVVGQMSRDDRLTLIRVTNQPEEIVSRYQADHTEMGARIEELQGASTRANMLTTLSHLSAQHDPASRRPPLIYLFTDGQASGWREVMDAGRNPNRDDLLPPGSRLIVIDVGSPEARPNVAVVGNPPPGQRTLVGLPLALTAQVVNHSPSDPADVVLTTVIEEKEAARASLSLRPGEKATIPMVYVPDAPGVKRGRFEISTKSGNVFPDDDRYLFTIGAALRVKVLLVNGMAAADPRDTESVYLRAALISVPGSESQPGDLRPENLEVQEILEPAVTVDNLNNADVVVLANCGTLQAPQFQALRAFVANGGGLLIFPGDKTTPELYNRAFFNGPGAADEPLMAANLGQVEGDPDKPETFERLAAIDFDHPVLSVFDDPDSRLLRSVRIFRHFDIPLTEPRGSTKSLARLASGQPALVESSFGQGRVVLAAFPAHVRWTNLPLKPEFVPLVLRLTSHVLRRPAVEGPNVVSPGALAEVSASLGLADARITLTDPSGRTRSLPEFQRSPARLIAGFDQTHERGYYTLEVQGAVVPTEPLMFAVNGDPLESNFAPITKESLETSLPGTTIDVIDASAEAQQIHGALNARTELWAWPIAGLFIVIGVEFLLATRPERKSADSTPSGRWPSASKAKRWAFGWTQSAQKLPI